MDAHLWKYEKLLTTLLETNIWRISSKWSSKSSNILLWKKDPWRVKLNLILAGIIMAKNTGEVLRFMAVFTEFCVSTQSKTVISTRKYKIWRVPSSIKNGLNSRLSQALCKNIRQLHILESDIQGLPLRVVAIHFTWNLSARQRITDDTNNETNLEIFGQHVKVIIFFLFSSTVCPFGSPHTS